MKKSIKPFIIGTVVGSLLTVSSVAFADTGIQAIKALLNKNLKVTVNGSAAKLDNPAITYDGKTYVYLKDISKLVGAQVNWNAKSKTVELKVDPSVIPTAPQTVAVYKDNAIEGTITDKEFVKYTTFLVVINPQNEQALKDNSYKEQILREYIGYKILHAKYGAKPLSKEDQTSYDKELSQFMGQFNAYVGQDASLQARMDRVGLTEKEIKLYHAMLTQVPQAMEKAVTDNEVKTTFEAIKADYNIVTVRHILIGTNPLDTGGIQRTDAEALERANKVRQLLVDGGDWAALAKEYSEDPGSSGNGGLYENQQSKGWVVEFKDAANTQPVGEIGQPVKTDYGYHVIQVEKRTEKSFDQLTTQEVQSVRSSIAKAKFDDFMSKELPGKITKLDMTKA